MSSKRGDFRSSLPTNVDEPTDRLISECDSMAASISDSVMSRIDRYVEDSDSKWEDLQRYLVLGLLGDKIYAELGKLHEKLRGEKL